MDTNVPFLKSWYVLVIIMGVISGIAVSLVPPVLPIHGIIFGAAAAAYFSLAIKPRLPPRKYVFWILASAASFVVAWFELKEALSDTLAQGIAGLIGVSIIAAAFHFFIQRLHGSDIVMLIIAGIFIPVLIFPLAFPVATAATPLLPPLWPFWRGIFFVAWQTMVLFVFGHRIHSAQIQQPPEAILRTIEN
ncbi:MAG: hypothetical protein KGH79_05000 [Patescibacteria group bacterium]|nr:hypothetical protein [Patescibacteria group bacterium]